MSIDTFWRQAQQAHAAGDAAGVQRSLRAALQMAPQFGDGYFELGNSLLSDGRAREAAAGYRAALRTGQLSDVPMAYNNLGNTLVDIGETESAMREYRRGLRLAPTFTYLHNGLANALSSQSRDAEAAATLKSAVLVQPSAHYAHYNLGNALRKMKQHAEAEAAYMHALEAAPSDGRYTQGFGQLCHETGRLHEATSMYATAQRQLAAQGLPRSAPLERDHASALREAKRYDEAGHYHRVPPDRKDSPSKGGAMVWESSLKVAPRSRTNQTTSRAGSSFVRCTKRRARTTTLILSA